MKKIYVTGASGYIGRHFIKKYSDHYNIHGIDVREKYNPSLNAGHFVGKFDDKDVAYLLERDKPAAVIHLAANTSVSESVKWPLNYYENNVRDVMRLIDYVKDTSPECKFIFASSAAVYGNRGRDNRTCVETDVLNPCNPYGRTKLFIENFLADISDYTNTSYVNLRFFNVCGQFYGLDDYDPHLIPAATRRLITGEPVTVHGVGHDTYDGTCVRDYVHVEDVCDAIQLAIESEATGSFNISTNDPWTVNEVVHEIAAQGEYNLNWDPQPRREIDPAWLLGDNSKAKELLGWEPKRKVEEGIAETIKFYK